MLIRCKGYNTGAQEYLEEGVKEGREFTRDELDERVMLDGDLDLTRMVYDSIPDKGQERYLSFTMGFKEDHVSYDTLHALTTEFKQFIMYAYKDEEFNFYAEAHLPKIKHIRDKKTGEMIERKPHIHIIIPRKNLLSGNEANPVGIYTSNEKYFEAFQEYLNQKYNLASPRENIRIDPKDAASVLSRYKGDDFYGKNREFKQNLVKQVIENNVTSRAGFYALVASHGETRVRNEGKPNEYIAVKLPDDAKFTNLKDTIFQDDFIVRRQLKKPPLDKGIIEERLQAWPQRAKELKYVSKATPAFRDRYYKHSTDAERAQLLIEREYAFYQTYGESNDVEPITVQRPRSNQRSVVEAGPERTAEASNGLQNMSARSLADHGQTGTTGSRDGALLLSTDAHVHLGQSDPGGDPGLRLPLRRGGREGATAERSGGRAGILEAATTGADTASTRTRTSRRAAAGIRAERAGYVIPPYARNPHRVASIADIEERGRRLFDPLKQPVDSELVIALAVAVDPSSQAPPDASEVKSRAARVRKPRGKGSSNQDIPPYARNPHRVASIADIEERGRRLFDPLKQTVDSELVIGLAATAGAGGRASPDMAQSQTTPRVRKPRKPRGKGNKSNDPPPYARNPHRVATISDIEARGLRLFEPLKRPVDSELVMKLATIKPVAVNRNASTVAAYFNRQIEQNQLLPAQRRAVQRVNKRFFEVRRSIFSDDRLTRQDKAQLVSVLTFERMKAREAIQNPELHKEATYMGSAEIRGLVSPTPEEENPEFSISGPGASDPAPVRDRLKRLVKNLSFQVDDKTSKERERELSAKDIYTKKARFSQNVHYIDKKTDRTLFVDTGTSIALRRTGITEAGVSVALQLAQQRFGSTLTINGTAEFKRLVIEAAAKGGMDIHFTDKAMNDSLAARRTELEIEREGQAIGQATAPAPDDATIAPAAAVPASAAPGAAAPAAPAGPAESSFILEREAEWRSTMGLSEAEVLSSATVMQLRGEDHAMWLVASNDQSPAAAALLTSYMENDSYRESFKSTIEDIYAKVADSPEAAQSLEPAMSIAERIVNSVERQLSTTVPPAQLPRLQVGPDAAAGVNAMAQEARDLADELGITPEIEALYAVGLVAGEVSNALGTKLASVVLTERINFLGRVADTLGIPKRGVRDAGQAEFAAWQQARAARVSTAAPAPVETVVDRKLIQGELIEHGPAPYQNKPTNGPSYFVTLKTEAGNRTVWGTALEEAMQNEQFKPGESIKLRDLGTIPVVIQVKGADGSLTPKDAVRRGWSVESTETTTRNAPDQAATSSTTAPITLTHNSEPITVDPANAADVAKYTKQLTNEVAHQRESIGHATQRIGMLENMRDNHSAGRGPEFVSECNAEIARGKQFIAGSEAIIGKAEAGLQQLGALPAPAVSATEASAPQSAAWRPSAAAPVVAPITLTHNSEPITVDPSNAADVAKYTRQLTNEVSVQHQRITNVSKRIGMLENMRDNHSAGRGPEYIERCNVEIATAQGQIDGSKGIIERAEVGLKQLASIPAQLDRTEAVNETPTVATESAVLVETVVEEEHGPEMS